MKKVYLFIGLMLSVLAIGCTNNGTEDQNQPVQGGNKDVVVTVNATLPSDLVWAEGDKVAVNGLESSAVTAEGAGGATYAFTAAKTTAPVVVVAPFEIMTGLGEVTLPATQEYVADGFDRAAYGMAAIAPELTQVGEDEKNLEASVNLLPVMGVVSLPLTLDSATAENAVAVKQVSFTAIGGAAINGVWNAEATTATDEAGVTTYDVKLTAVKGSTSTNLDCGEGVAIDTVAPAYFNLVVPAGTYTGGFEIVVTDTADHNFVLALAEDVVVERGAVVELAPSVFTVVDKAPATLTVTIAEQGMTWLEGDAIVCNNSLSTNTVAADAAGTQTAQFSFDAVAYPYSVFYPAEYYTTSGSLRFYDEQPLIKDGYDCKNMVMVGYSNTNEVTLNNLCGVVTIPVTNKYEGETIIIDKVEVATAEGDAIAGKYHINYRTGDITVVSGKSSIVLTPETADAFAIEPEATANISFVVPRGSIRNGLKLNIYSSVGLLENHKIFPTGLTVRGGETSTADLYEFKEVKIEKIMTAEELIDFAKCVNMGRYKKYVNAEGKVVLGGDIDMSSISAENWPMIKGVEVEGVPTGFDGIFDGCGYSLKNWVATMPLFHTLAATGKISNLVIDSSCNLIVPTEHYSGLSGSNGFAFVVAQLAGEVENVTNNADASYVTSNHPATILGLIVGSPVPGANVRNCVNNGNFTLEIGNHKNGTGYFGTVCGRMVEDANHPTCGIFNCKNYGNLTITIVDANTGANCYIGGVTGSSNSYTVTEGCENYGNISFTTEQSNNAVLLAGVTSYSAGPVRNCINEGNVSFYSKGSYKSSIISGIASYVNGPISDCVNKGDITLKAEKNFAGRNSIGGIDGKSSSSTSAPACSGVCGYGYTSATSVFTMDRCSNYGKITYHWTDATGSGTSGYPMAAGVVSAPRGNVTDCHNYGDIDANFGNSGATIKLISYYGGVVAADVYAVKEQSSTSVYNCTNSGNITVHNDVCDASNNALGGIIGWPGSETKASCTNETKGCTNTGNITMSGKGKFRCGCIQGGSGRVIDCVNSGNLTINSSAAGSVFGGLAGFHSGGYELTGSTTTGSIVANCVLDTSGGIGGMCGNLGNAAHAEGMMVNNTIKCIVKAPEGCCGVGMVCGHFNGNSKTIYFGTADAPIKVGGSLQIGETVTVVDASNVMDPAVLGNHCKNYSATAHIYNCVLAQ